jgi:hypothetical protein
MIEILVYNTDLEEKINNEGLSKEDHVRICEQYEFDEVKDIKDVNIGPGADHWVVFMEVTAAGITILTLGKNLEDGLAWWISTGKKINSIFKRKELISVDEKGAIAMALNFIVEKQKEPIQTIALTDKYKIKLTDLTKLMGDGRDENSIISQPHNLYILTILLNNYKIYVLAVQSDGNIEVVKCYEIASGFYELKENKK